MPKLPSLLLSLLLAAAAGSLAPLAAAAAPGAPVVAQSNGMSLQEAVRRVQRQYGGRIVSAHTETRGGREVHVIRVMTDDGTVRTVRMPGRSARGG